MSQRATCCEACGNPLSLRGRAVTGLCFACRQAGAAFARAWMVELHDQGLSNREVASVLDTTENTVACRLRDERLLKAATP